MSATASRTPELVLPIVVEPCLNNIFVSLTAEAGGEPPGIGVGFFLQALTQMRMIKVIQPMATAQMAATLASSFSSWWSENANMILA